MWTLPRGLYGIVDPAGDPFEQVRILAEEGVGVVQLRCKGWPPERLLALGSSARGITVIVNDDVAIARQLGVAVHLGQGDGPDPEDVPFGRSTHTLEQVASPGRAAYIGFGPVFGTASKVSAWSPRGVQMLAEAVRRSRVPVVAIGGITAENLPAVKATGVHGWAVIGALWRGGDARGNVRGLR